MKLRNPFPQEVRLLFLYVFSCFKCARSDRGLELHHIFGRVSDSPFNACPLCPVCHAMMGHNRSEELELYITTADFLYKENYKPTEKDWEFIKQYAGQTIRKGNTTSNL